jgi:hypothetical protein
MAAPWEKFQKLNAGSESGPWDKFQAAKPQEKKPQGPSALDSVGAGITNAVTLGYYPEIEAAAAPLISKVGDALTGSNTAPALQGKNFAQRREESAKDMQAIAAANPGSYAAGNVVGAIGSGALLPVAKGATMGARALSSGRLGGLLGFIQNQQQTEGAYDPIQLESRLKGGLFGAALGGGLQLGGDKLVSSLRGTAEQRAFKSLGPYSREAQNNYARGKINEVGREILDQGIVGGRPRSYESIAKRAGEAKTVAGQNLGNVVDDLAVAGQQSGISPIARKSVSDQLRQELLGNPELPGVAKRNESYEALINAFENGGDMDLTKIRELKQAIKDGNLINWKRLPDADIPQDERFYRSLNGQLIQAENELAAAIAAGTGKSKQFEGAKRAYGAADEALNISSKREGREFANRFLSPTDYFTGGAGAVAGFSSGDSIEERIKRAAIGAGLALANKGARQYGNQITAMGANNMAKALGTGVVDNPNTIPYLANRMTALIQGADTMTPEELDPFIRDPQIKLMFENDPSLLETIRDPMRRTAIKRQLNRGPAKRK